MVACTEFLVRTETQQLPKIWWLSEEFAESILFIVEVCYWMRNTYTFLEVAQKYRTSVLYPLAWQPAARQGSLNLPASMGKGNPLPVTRHIPR
jgi:hypothetical protein